MLGEINVKNVYKEFKTPVLKSGLRGSVLGLFQREHKIIQAVNGISFDISPGEIVGYIGPNGAGKTTTVKLLSGILRPSRGGIKVNGLDPFADRKAHARQVGVMLGNQSRLFWNLPVRESFFLLQKIYQVGEVDFRKRFDKLVSLLEIESLLSQQARTLSLGQRMRCELVTLFLHSPPVVFLDEPTIGLDVSVKAKILDFIREINQKETKTVILTSHDIHDIEELAQRVIVIALGKCVFDGDLRLFREKFGTGEKKLTIDLAKFVQETTLQSSLCGDVFQVLSFDGYKLTLKVKKRMSTADILAALDGIISIRDVHIVEESITEMVKRIYERKASV